MAIGRKTGGRKKGTPNKIKRPRKAQAALTDRLAAGGITPLEYMLNILRDDTAEPLQRSWAAEKAAPYCHSRLAPIDPKTGEQPVTHIVMRWQGTKQPNKS